MVGGRMKGRDQYWDIDGRILVAVAWSRESLINLGFGVIRAKN